MRHSIFYLCESVNDSKSIFNPMTESDILYFSLRLSGTFVIVDNTGEVVHVTIPTETDVVIRVIIILPIVLTWGHMMLCCPACGCRSEGQAPSLWLVFFDQGLFDKQQFWNNDNNDFIMISIYCTYPEQFLVHEREVYWLRHLLSMSSDGSSPVSCSSSSSSQDSSLMRAYILLGR